MVLRYDKRTCGPFNGCAENGYPTPAANTNAYDFIEDALAAIDFLKTLPEVDASRLVAVGHSQGATFVPSMMRDRAEIVAGVMIAGNHRPMDQMVAYQMDFSRRLLAESGVDNAAIDQTLNPLSTMVTELEALRAGQHESAPIGGASVEFWQSMFEVGDQAPAIAKALDRPLLAIGGEYDWNVPPEEIAAWGTTFGEAQADPGHRSETVPCVTHALNCVSQPDYRRITPADIGRTVHEGVVERIEDFLSATLR